MGKRLDLASLRLVPSSGADSLARKLAGLDERGGEARLGIMGGTFDPIHTGHLACAEMAMDACGLDGVLFMVAPRPWMKHERRIADAPSRLAMCALATEGNERFALSAMEVERAGKTYTSDTLRELAELLPGNVALSFIIGADTLKTLPGWHDAEGLCRMAEFVCVDRPGREDAGQLLHAAQQRGFRIKWVDAPLLDISSSEIRHRIGAGMTVRYLLPEPVRAYIEDHGLYKGDFHG